MNLEAIMQDLQTKANGIDPIGATLKFKLDDNIVYVDGNGENNVLSNEDKDADCVISTSMATFEKLKAGKLNPTMAVMMGKIKVKGDLGIAMKLQSLMK